MAGTFSQMYVHFVFAVKHRQNRLQKPWRDEVFKYMSAIIQSKNHKSIIVNGVSDHVHVFVGLKPHTAPSDLVRDVKNNSSRFINERKFVESKFQWQEGYGVFTYSQSQVNNVYRYIENQEEHHKKKSFKEEYINLLQKFEVKYEERFLFDWFEE